MLRIRQFWAIREKSDNLVEEVRLAAIVGGLNGASEFSGVALNRELAL